MTDLTVYHLTPKSGSGFHFGEEGLEQETSRLTYPSDSLFAALIATIADQEGATAVTDFMTPFCSGRPPFKLTTIFPRVGRFPLLPLPQLHISTRQQREQQAGKRPLDEPPLLKRKFTRKTKFVSPAIFNLLAAGADMDDYLQEEKQGTFMQNGAVWLTQQEFDTLSDDDLKTGRQIWRNDPIHHVVLDRVTSSSTPYITGRVSFAADCGLWLGVEYHDDAIQDRLELLLHHLGDRGLGGERSRGYGGFTLTHSDPLPLETITNPNGRYLLSRYYPREDEMAALTEYPAAYQLVTIGGYFRFPGYPTLRRKKITMLETASILARKEIKGAIKDVKPDPVKDEHGDPVLDSQGNPLAFDDDQHVYRYGLPLTLPIHANPPKDSHA